MGLFSFTWRKPYDHINQMMTSVFYVAHHLRPHHKEIISPEFTPVKAPHFCSGLLQKCAISNCH